MNQNKDTKKEFYEFLDNGFLEETELSNSFDKELFELMLKYSGKISRFHIAKLLIGDAVFAVISQSTEDEYFEDLGILNHFLNDGIRDKICL